MKEIAQRGLGCVQHLFRSRPLADERAGKPIERSEVGYHILPVRKWLWRLCVER
jgi:hypothetical protein